MTRWHHQMVYHLHHFILKFRQHRSWLYSLVILSGGLALLNMNQGELKPTKIWSWLDLIGEGASVLFIAIWLVILLATRSKGRTTTLLALGLLGIYLSNLQDFLDEFFELSHHRIPWDSLVESLPIGLVLFTLGMLYWYREQQALHTYLAQRNTSFENNHKINPETGLASMSTMLIDIEQTYQQVTSEQLLQLNILHINSNKINQTIAEQAEFKRVCSDLLLSKASEYVRIYHLTGDHYAVLASVSNEENDTLITSLKQTVENHYCCNNNHSINVSFNYHSLYEGQIKTEIENLVMATVKFHAHAHAHMQLVG